MLIEKYNKTIFNYTFPQFSSSPKNDYVEYFKVLFDWMIRFWCVWIINENKFLSSFSVSTSLSNVHSNACIRFDKIYNSFVILLLLLILENQAIKYILSLCNFPCCFSSAPHNHRRRRHRRRRFLQIYSCFCCEWMETLCISMTCTPY